MKYKTVSLTWIAGNYFNCNIFWLQTTLESATYWIKHRNLAFKSIRRLTSLRKSRYILVDIYCFPIVEISILLTIWLQEGYDLIRSVQVKILYELNFAQQLHFLKLPFSSLICWLKYTLNWNTELMSGELSFTPSDVRLPKYCVVVPTLDERCRLCTILQLIPNSVNDRLWESTRCWRIIKRYEQL
jgi:hypothetical protein